MVKFVDSRTDQSLDSEVDKRMNNRTDKEWIVIWITLGETGYPYDRGQMDNRTDV